MPKTRLQQLVYALLTVFITVHCFVFYNLALEMGGMSNAVFVAARNVVGIEFLCAILIEVLVAGPLATRIAFKSVNPAQDKPWMVSGAIVCATVSIMCPAMSFIATILYDGVNVEFLANWMQKIVINFPFALLTQLFFIQPVVRRIFGLLFGGRRQAVSVVAEEGSFAE